MLIVLGYFPLKTPSVYRVVKTLEGVSLYVLFPSSVVLIIMQKYMCCSKVIAVEGIFFLRFVSCISLCDRTCLSLPLKKELL